MSDVSSWLRLTLSFGAANPELWVHAARFESVGEFAENLSKNRISDLSGRVKESAAKITQNDVDGITDKCSRENVRIICFDDDNYPQRLRTVSNPPPVLFVKGDACALNFGDSVAIVGTRTPCEYSLEVTNKLCAELAKKNITVISGFEPGIDMAANRAALMNSGKTVAVCGRGVCDDHSLNDLTPDVRRKGVLVSEITDTSDFVYLSYDMRNRILCGLADGVLFVECSEQSRGLNNVIHARALGRTVFAIPPHDINDPRFFGQRNLLRSEAVPVFGIRDIVNNLHRPFNPNAMFMLDMIDEFDKNTEQKPQKNKNQTKKHKKIQKNDKEGLHKTQMSATIDMSGLSQRQISVCEQLASGEKHLNELSEKLEISVSELMNELVYLQIKSIVDELPGKLYCLRGSISERN